MIAFVLILVWLFIDQLAIGCEVEAIVRLADAGFCGLAMLVGACSWRRSPTWLRAAGRPFVEAKCLPETALGLAALRRLSEDVIAALGRLAQSAAISIGAVLSSIR